MSKELYKIEILTFTGLYSSLVRMGCRVDSQKGLLLKINDGVF